MFRLPVTFSFLSLAPLSLSPLLLRLSLPSPFLFPSLPSLSSSLSLPHSLSRRFPSPIRLPPPSSHVPPSPFFLPSFSPIRSRLLVSVVTLFVILTSANGCQIYTSSPPRSLNRHLADSQRSPTSLTSLSKRKSTPTSFSTRFPLMSELRFPLASRLPRSRGFFLPRQNCRPLLTITALTYLGSCRTISFRSLSPSFSSQRSRLSLGTLVPKRCGDSCREML